MIISTVLPLMKLDRMTALLKKSAVEGVEIEPHPTRPGVYLVTSGTGRKYSNGEAVKYTASSQGCSCPAGANGRECKHYALALNQMIEEGCYDVEVAQWEMEWWVCEQRFSQAIAPTGSAAFTVGVPPIARKEPSCS